MLKWTMIAVVCSAVFHASLELKGKLDDYLGEVVGFIPPRWLKYAFFVLALAIILAPLELGFFLQENSLLAFAAGALVGDTLSTHLIPTWSHLARRSSPATWTWILYLPLAGAIVFNLRPFNCCDAVGIIAGMLAFVALWPTLAILTIKGLLPKTLSI